MTPDNPTPLNPMQVLRLAALLGRIYYAVCIAGGVLLAVCVAAQLEKVL